MRIDPKHWLAYARDNLAVSRLCLPSGLWNPCLQNAQQTVEKSLKAMRSHKGLPDKRTHGIRVLWQDLMDVGLAAEMDVTECILLDSIFMESKYPASSVMPDGPPDEATCQECVAIAERIFTQACRECREPL
jgi:HEPN domain-containing protein